MNGSPRRKDTLSRSSSGKAARASCLHCGTPIVEGLEAADATFCCRGCAEVYRLLNDAGLSRYYDLGGGAGHPVDALSSRSATVDRKWLEPITLRVQTLASAAAGPASQHRTRVVLDAQGVHCAACVWLFEKLFQKRARACAAPAGEGQQIIVNPAVGSIELTIAPDFDIAGWVGDVESFGYRLGPSLKGKDSAKQSDLVWRMGVCIAIAMNTMIFGFALYCGLSSGPVFRLFHALDFGLSLLSVIVGGSVFFRSAWQALRRRVLHLDLPIALGILLVFVSSTYTYATRGGATSYFDTLNVFIALMLVGRFLQERVIAKNKAMLLASDGAEGIYTRRVSEADSGGGDSIKNVTLVRCTEIKEGDILLLGHGDVVPVESILLASENQASALFSLDWISGESAPKSFEPGAIVPAGAFSQGARAVRVKTIAPFDESTLVSLLRTSTRRDEDLARSTSWHKRLTGIYVVSVLTIAALTFVGWMIGTHGDVARTLDVVASVLIITCPCAFGIATPLAYELAQAGLRRVGLYVRTPGFLDRAAELTRVVFDKTGTLTTGELVVAEDAKKELALLSENDLNRLYALTVCSAHPKSRAIATALEHLKGGSARAFNTSADVREIPGKGLELRDAATGDLYRVGARAWTLAPAVVPSIGPTQQQPHASPPPHLGDVFFTRNGEVLMSIATTEHLRTDAASEVKALKELGYDVWVLSGDEHAATRAMARAVGIPEDQAIAGHSPTKKAEWLRGGAKTLFIGDGINDSLVAEEAYCAGTPAIDRPFMASRCDFYFVTPGLRPIRQALLTARKLAQVVRRNLLIALFYNVITVLLAVAGLMTPLLCAVLMPLSSVSTVLATTAQLSLSSSRGKRDRANQNLLDVGQN